MQSVPKTTKVMCSNPAHGEVYSIQHNVIKFFSVRWFSPATSVSSTNKTDCQDKADIVLKVAKSTINQVKSSNENEVKYIELRRIIVINEMIKLMRNLIIYLL